jgi:hypothetical protein
MAGGFIPVERPPGAIDIEEFAAATFALEQAKQGKPEPLIERLRSAKTLLPEERALAADIIARDWKRRSNGRPAQHPEALRIQKVYLALCVLEQRANKKSHKEAVGEVADKTKMSQSSIRKAVRANEGMFGSLLRRRRSGK